MWRNAAGKADSRYLRGLAAQAVGGGVPPTPPRWASTTHDSLVCALCPIGAVCEKKWWQTLHDPHERIRDRCESWQQRC
jgi:hypothetical protein